MRLPSLTSEELDVTDVSETEQEAVSEIYDANTVGAETTYSSTTIKSGGSNTIKAMQYLGVFFTRYGKYHGKSFSIWRV